VAAGSENNWLKVSELRATLPLHIEIEREGGDMRLVLLVLGDSDDARIRLV